MCRSRCGRRCPPRRNTSFPHKRVPDLLSGHQLRPTLNQQDQEIHRLPLETDRSPPATQLVSRDVQLEVAESECSVKHPAGDASGVRNSREPCAMCHLLGQQLFSISSRRFHGSQSRPSVRIRQDKKRRPSVRGAFNLAADRR